MSFLSSLLSLFTPDTTSIVAPIEAKRQLAAPSGERPRCIDVRTSGEWKQGRIQGATHLDASSPEFDNKIRSLPRDASYLLYCQSGARSGAALRRMKSAGFTDVKHLGGGMGAWKRAAYPVVK